MAPSLERKLTPATAQFWGEKTTEELYEMSTDPDSVHNLAGDPKYREALKNAWKFMEPQRFASGGCLWCW